MRVLVTGCTGFLGRHLVRALRKDKRVEFVFGVSRSAKVESYYNGRPGWAQVSADLQHRDVVQTILTFEPDVIFHFAANPSTQPGNSDLCQDNILPTHHLLEHCKKGTRFVYASSATIYGDGDLEHPHEDGDAPWPTSVYAATKLASEHQVDVYTRQGKVSGVFMRYVACVGAGATHGLLRDIVHKLQLPSETIELLGERPGSIKPFVHVEDAVSAAVHFGLHTSCPGPLNISASGFLSVQHVAHLAMNVTGITKPIVWKGKDSIWKGDNQIVNVSNWRALSRGWSPRYSSSVEAVCAAAAELIASEGVAA